MARDVYYPAAVDEETPTAPLLFVSHTGFLRATGEELRSPDPQERIERLRRGLGKLDNDFPQWLEAIESETADGLVLRFRDIDALRNVEVVMRNHGMHRR